MKVSLASALGTCFGVQDAINLAMAPEFRDDLTIVGQLVHNPQINESLKKNGVAVVHGIEQIDEITEVVCAKNSCLANHKPRVRRDSYRTADHGRFHRHPFSRREIPHLHPMLVDDRQSIGTNQRNGVKENP